MTIFTSFGRRRSLSHGDGAGQELPESVRQALPPRFEAVGEALAAAVDPRPACAVVGRAVARDGAALGEALDGLRTTFGLVLGVEPDFESTQTLSVAWSEATLEFLHTMSCEDPLTGLVSLAHLRTRLDEMYREAEHTGESVATCHGLVVLELTAGDPRRRVEHQFTRALHLVQVAESARVVFGGGETIARLSTDRAAVLVHRRPELGASVSMLRDLLGALDLGATVVRVWIEGLPAVPSSASQLLDELAR